LSVPSIEAVHLSKKYGSFLALSDLNLKLEGTKCVGFLGPNGAGKTTTLKIFTDLIRSSSGEALINGVNVHTHKRQALASVASLIETPEIYPSLTPREALMMICEIRGVPKSERNTRIEESIKEVHMDEWIDKRVGKFSKGMKQRICIASALLSNPSVLLLDEPTTGLDPRGMSEVSSHILSEVSEICDEVAMIDHGKLIVYDTISNVTAKFSGGESVVEVGLRESVDPSFISKRIPSLKGVVSVRQKDARTLSVRFSGGLDVQESLLTNLVRLNIGVVSYRPASSELEDVYLKLIKDTL
jgi:ABC-2 type transport system ATP-binding protein